MTFETESVRFLHFHGFDREWANLGLADEAHRSLQNARPTPSRPGRRGDGRSAQGPVRPTGDRQRQERRVSSRRCPPAPTADVHPHHGLGKNQKANISQAERNALAKAIRAVEQVLEQGEIQ
jgi:hypothetical protein